MIVEAILGTVGVLATSYVSFRRGRAEEAKLLADAANAAEEAEQKTLTSLWQRQDQLSARLHEITVKQAEEQLAWTQERGKLSGQISSLEHQLLARESELATLRSDLDNVRRDNAQLRGELADSQAVVEGLAADLQITADHVAALQEQLTRLGQEPEPRPTQPRNPNGTYARKGKKS